MEIEKKRDCAGAVFLRIDFPGCGNGSTDAEIVELEATGEDGEAIAARLIGDRPASA